MHYIQCITMALVYLVVQPKSCGENQEAFLRLQCAGQIFFPLTQLQDPVGRHILENEAVARGCSQPLAGMIVFFFLVVQQWLQLLSVKQLVEARLCQPGEIYYLQASGGV